MPITLSRPDSVMDTVKMVLTFESVDEILWCDHSNENSSAALSLGTTFFSKLNAGFVLNFDLRHSWE